MSSGSEWDALRRSLQALTHSVAQEISAYPRPITACDAQFNHLLELRRALPAELARLDAAVSAGTSVGDFVRASPCAAALAELVDQN
jgi:hypothetical protein